MYENTIIKVIVFVQLVHINIFFYFICGEYKMFNDR